MNEDSIEDISIDETPDDNQIFGLVTDMLGANRVEARCIDGEVRTCRIPGRMRKREWIREDDIVIVEPWEWQDEKADIVHRYEQHDAEKLREEGILEDES